MGLIKRSAPPKKAANEYRVTVRTHELNLYSTGGWLSTLSSIGASSYGHRSRGESHRNGHQPPVIHMLAQLYLRPTTRYTEETFANAILARSVQFGNQGDITDHRAEAVSASESRYFKRRSSRSAHSELRIPNWLSICVWVCLS